MKQLAACLGIQPGVTTFIGGGGKTSAIFQIARELKAQNKRVVVSTTTKMYYPTKTQIEEVLINPTEEMISVCLERVGALVVAGGCQEDKITSISWSTLEVAIRLADYVLIEGDGSKRLPLKVPALHEPVIPDESGQVVVVVGLSSLNERLEDVCFRKDRAVALLGIASDCIVDEQVIAQIVSHPNGLQKGIDEKKQVLLLNQVDLMESKERLDYMIEVIKKDYTYPIIAASLVDGQWQEV
ncbi:MAG: selenium cofactor biosynthesis protein YqeC [Cellulosilyticaceae bacterium]